MDRRTLFRSLPALAGVALLAVWGEASVAAEDPKPAPAPIPLASGNAGKNYLNLSIDGLVAAGWSTEPDVESLQTGGHDPSQRGFSIQNVEIVFDGAVDPYFRAQANLILQIDPEGETVFELEEVFAVTTSLPGNLQVKAGQYLSEFGRLNPTHPHTWDFVDQPLVSGRMFGGDGMRSPGARVAWLMPVPFYSELYLSIQNGKGETLPGFGGVSGDTYFGRTLDPDFASSGSDFLYVPRYAASFDPTDTQTVLLGASGAFGPNGTGDGGSTSVLGVDGFWKWKSPRAQKGFPFVKVQVEAMRRRYEAAETEAAPAETFRDHGAYAQVVWGIRPMWTAGLRLDDSGGDVGDDPLDPRFQPRRRASVQGTWYPTEYSKVRLQVSWDDRTGAENVRSAWLQFEFLLGAHAAHTF